MVLVEVSLVLLTSIFLYLSFGFCVGKGTDLIVASSKGVFSGGTGGAICCDNSSRFITGVPVLGDVRGKLGRNFDFGFSICFVSFFVLVYICILWFMFLQDLSEVITLGNGSMLILLTLI